MQSANLHFRNIPDRSRSLHSNPIRNPRGKCLKRRVIAQRMHRSRGINHTVDQTRMRDHSGHTHSARDSSRVPFSSGSARKGLIGWSRREFKTRVATTLRKRTGLGYRLQEKFFVIHRSAVLRTRVCPIPGRRAPFLITATCQPNRVSPTLVSRTSIAVPATLAGCTIIKVPT